MKKVMVLCMLLIFYINSAINPVHADGLQQVSSSKIEVRCESGLPSIVIKDWEKGEMLKVFADDEEIGDFETTETDGSGYFSFGEEGEIYDLLVERSNGDVIIAGVVNCAEFALEPDYLKVEPFELTLPVDASYQLSAFGFDKDDNEVEVALLWTVEGGSITSDGLFDATEVGIFVISAQCVNARNTITVLVNILVTPPIERLEINPAEATLVVGDAVEFSVIAFDIEGNIVPVIPKWEAESGEILSSGFFIPNESGVVTITASIEESTVTGTAIVKVIPPVERIEIIPDGATLALNEKQQFTVVGFGADGDEVEMPSEPVWEAEIGEITSSGLYTGTTGGEDVITVAVEQSTARLERVGDGISAARRPPLFDSVIVLVLRPDMKPGEGELHHIEVTPSNVTLKPGQQQQFEARGFDQYGNEVSAKGVVWGIEGGVIAAGAILTPDGLVKVDGAGLEEDIELLVIARVDDVDIIPGEAVVIAETEGLFSGFIRMVKESCPGIAGLLAAVLFSAFIAWLQRYHG
ncbi:MAG: hypothetical protein MUO76_04970 [Anaerolineaceae bacterium]|nr:hypothetical protein [Anaerolineaceae bacterium]